ncbi:4-hydroxyphenylpyruvate dioxygenase [Gloeocapsa sp. PCC 73106]|uniref:4-hydroxyphenylpyruvate dioxygenase n=1 Tax=Gloeocapsa sp. PCC 73106 TaxID=102232 RepID=UPI0002ACFF84|nr:4-hydroxyphenylpyruvate dioxygenase [Gloeocapsa sp. PCC 73106]ELR99484.1 4-hydroxyphenylpyruvate dioxygenase [Gloeocapsa sp. PCC 73106]
MWIDHVHFYVEDAKQWRDWFVHLMGFRAIASKNDGTTITEIVSSQEIVFWLSSPIKLTSPVAKYLRLHPPGVVDLAFLVENLEPILARATTHQVSVLGSPRRCQLITPFQFKHTLIEGNRVKPVGGRWFTHIDHLVLNVAQGELQMMVKWYETIFGFQSQQSFLVSTERSALSSQVMVHPKSGIQLPINEPVDANSQIQEFLDLNGGAGIQHIALFTPEITFAVSQLRDSGLKFLAIPDDYYQQLLAFNLSEEEYQQLKTQGILADIQSTSKLLQIFTEPIFSAPTFFFELIERREKAQGFGAANFQVLFEAIEREQIKRSI